jgi:hypothetical protein
MSLAKRLYERQPTAADRLENARQRVRFALCCADDGEPTFVHPRRYITRSGRRY